MCRVSFRECDIPDLWPEFLFQRLLGRITFEAPIFIKYDNPRDRRGNPSGNRELGVRLQFLLRTWCSCGFFHCGLCGCREEISGRAGSGCRGCLRLRRTSRRNRCRLVAIHVRIIEQQPVGVDPGKAPQNFLQQVESRFVATGNASNFSFIGGIFYKYKHFSFVKQVKFIFVKC